jgi:hypothetical protein
MCLQDMRTLRAISQHLIHYDSVTFLAFLEVWVGAVRGSLYTCSALSMHAQMGVHMTWNSSVSQLILYCCACSQVFVCHELLLVWHWALCTHTEPTPVRGRPLPVAVP